MTSDHCARAADRHRTSRIAAADHNATDSATPTTRELPLLRVHAVISGSGRRPPGRSRSAAPPRRRHGGRARGGARRQRSCRRTTLDEDEDEPMIAEDFAGRRGAVGARARRLQHGLHALPELAERGGLQQRRRRRHRRRAAVTRIAGGCSPETRVYFACGNRAALKAHVRASRSTSRRSSTRTRRRASRTTSTTLAAGHGALPQRPIDRLRARADHRAHRPGLCVPAALLGPRRRAGRARHRAVAVSTSCRPL